MEKKGLRKKDMLRMDGLLPPTRRLPVCDAVSSTSEKKKDKKWSIGSILRRISSLKDYDSSSNDEEIVYCKRTPRKPRKFNRKPDGVVLHSMSNNSVQDKRTRIENNGRHSTGSPSHLRRDSLHSRSSEGSLDGLGKKCRKNKLKARAKAKRDHLCADSSSDESEHCRRSNGSLNRFHGADGSLNGQRSNACNRKTRAARTERYIKRLSRDDGNGSGDTLNEIHQHKRFASEYEQQQPCVVYAEVDGSCRPPVHPRRAYFGNNRTLPAYRSSAENLLYDRAGLSDHAAVGSLDFGKYSTGQYAATDMNQNNTYGKISRNTDRDVYASDRQAGHFFTYPTKNFCHYPESFDRGFDSPESLPPVPPPRDPRYCVLGFGYSSYPANKQQYVPNSYKPDSDKTRIINGLSRPDWRNFRSYGSNNEIDRCNPVRLESPARSEFRNSLECINNKYNCSRQRANEPIYRETEAMRCQRRNTRNDQLSCDDASYSAYEVKRKSANICETSKRETAHPMHVSVASPDWSSRRSPCERAAASSITPTYDVDKRTKKEISHQAGDKEKPTSTEEALERRRSSKNLEEALSELEAIYNSLRLGDEDLLDRAERRSMEEFSLKQSKNEPDAMAVTPDSPDRTKDDMAYRRMHPKERPTSLSDIAGQSTLSNISYLIASPVLSRRDSMDNLAHSPSTYRSPSRRDEPDVTRDDVVFRSINHANNTLKIIDPQPPFGIPLGPVTGATESDYLHTTPTKPEQPRSLYIPQCEPDVVTDDLAYRALRKDAGASATRNATENKVDAAGREPATSVCGAKKKRAVRSMSANLYGLINHDRIHLRREPDLDAARDEIQEDVTRVYNATAERRPEYLRRVVSDGELSESDVRRRKEWTKNGDTDINGNHPMEGVHREKPGSAVSSETTATRESPRKERKSNVAELSDAMLSSRTALGDEFWHEYLRPDSNTSNANSGHSTEADFTAYSRLCQDLVNMIRGGGDDDDDAPAIESSNVDDLTVPSDKSKELDVKVEMDESPTSHTHSLSSDYSRSRRPERANKREIEGEKTESSTSTTFSTSSTKPESESTSVSNLDFYLRVADENVKLIAAAFGSVADHVRDAGRLSARKNSSTSRDVSELEYQSGSARSSTLYSQDDASNDQSVQPTAVSSKFEEARVSSRCVSSIRNSLISDGGDHGSARTSYSERNVLTADMELDLSKAVRDLQLAAASLCEHEREMEDLGIGLRKKIDVAPLNAVNATHENDENSPIRRISLIADALREQERALEEEEKQQEKKKKKKKKKEEESITAIDEKEDSPIREISLIVDSLRQERERDHEEARSDAREESCEGERTVCELDRKSCRRSANARSDGTRVLCVTNNLITRATVTAYSMLLLACLLALLLAIVAAT